MSPKNLLLIAANLDLTSADRAELKAAYAEAALNRTLVSKAGKWPDPAAIAAHFALPRAPIGDRLGRLFTEWFRRQNLARRSGVPARRRRDSVSGSTTEKLCQGQVVSVANFHRVCRHLKLTRDEYTAARILFAEAKLGEPLLPQNPLTDFDGQPSADKVRTVLPRVAALLSFSVSHAELLGLLPSTSPDGRNVGHYSEQYAATTEIIMEALPC